MATPPHQLKARIKDYYREQRLDGMREMGGYALLSHIERTPGAREATGYWSKGDASHTSVGDWCREVDAELEADQRSRDPKHLQRVRRLRMIIPDDLAGLQPLVPGPQTPDYVLLLNKIHSVFFGRNLPEVAARAAEDHQQGLEGLDPFAACMLCLEFAVRDLVRLRKNELTEIGEESVAGLMNEHPTYALDLLAVRPWAGSGNEKVWGDLLKRGLIGGAPRTPFLAPPIPNRRMMPLIYWVLFRWHNPGSLHLDEFPETNWNWRKVMFMKPADIPDGLIDRVQQLMVSAKESDDE